MRISPFKFQLFAYLCSAKSPKDSGSKNSKFKIQMQILDSFDAIKLLNISRRSLYRFIKHGVLHPMRFPHSRKIYFSREEIERALSLKTHIISPKDI